jgi:hypothetical protein
VLRAEINTTHMADLANLRYDWEAYATIGTEHLLAEINQQVLMLKPYARLEATTLNYIPGQERETFTAWRAGIKLELPF